MVNFLIMSAHVNIKDKVNLPDRVAVIAWYGQLVESLRLSNQRLIVNLQGTREWCEFMLPSQAVFSQQVILSNQQGLQQGIPFSKAETLLGQEADCVVYDGFSGINIDVLCMASGLVKAGGILILLTTEQPHQVVDSYGQWQGRFSEKYYFLNYLLDQIKQEMLVMREHSSATYPLPVDLSFSAQPQFKNNMTVQQTELLQEMNSWIVNKKQSVFVLTADRGRGKSTLLGKFAQNLNTDLEIIITAASREQVNILLRQIDDDSMNIRFIAPDEIIRQNKTIHCLLIDEAAMLPNSMLQQCLNLSEKTLISTTTGGYEGTGQGFLIKFLAVINSSDYIHRKLTEAIRWGQQDAMESWLNRVLRLKPEPQKQSLILKKISIEQLSKEQLNKDSSTLRAIYALLVSAHYRTRPSDFRQLMEDENQYVLIARSGEDIAGVMLLNREGGLEEKMCHEIFMGTRRPQGHLFAQMLTAQAGIRGFTCLKGLRIQRLAVAENCRMQGIGRLLVKFAEQLVTDLNFEYLSSSFALDTAVSPFWNRMGFDLVHISAGKGKSTGRQTVAVLKSENSHVNEIIFSLKNKIKNYLPVWLLSYCQSLSWSDVYALLEMQNTKNKFSSLDEDELMAFCEGYRGFDFTQAVLQKLLISQLVNSGLSNPLKQLAIEKVLLNVDWEALSGVSGKKDALQQLRQGIKKLNEQRLNKYEKKF